VAGRKMAILGDMRELGDVSEEEHQKTVDLLQQAGFEQVWLVGDEFGKTNTEKSGCKTSFRKFHDVEEVKKAIAQEQPQQYYMLIKGSNSVKLYQLPELL